uniref:Uncharacterized protein n=1 Tax=Globodera pallida TaxID=36090 RepID=A0A183CFC3_GLOPA
MCHKSVSHPFTAHCLPPYFLVPTKCCANSTGASPQAPSFQQPFAPSFGCPLSALGAFGRQFPPPPPPSSGVAGGQFPMHGQSGNFPVNVMNPNFMGSSSQQQQNGGGGNNNFGTSGNNCNCGPAARTAAVAAATSFGMPSTAGGEFGGAIVGAGLNNMNNNVNGIAGGGGGGTIDMVNGGMGVFGRRRRR